MHCHDNNNNGSAAKDHGTTGKSGFAPTLRGAVWLFVCGVIRDFGTVIGGCFSVLFDVVGSVETVSHPGVCVGWVTVVYRVTLDVINRSPVLCGVWGTDLLTVNR